MTHNAHPFLIIYQFDFSLTIFSLIDAYELEQATLYPFQTHLLFIIASAIDFPDDESVS
ncbi:hypothetical protein ACV56Z_01600 [Staphylococcus aureus]